MIFRTLLKKQVFITCKINIICLVGSNMSSLLAQWNMTFLDYSESFNLIFKFLKWSQQWSTWFAKRTSHATEPIPGEFVALPSKHLRLITFLWDSRATSNRYLQDEEYSRAIRGELEEDYCRGKKDKRMEKNWRSTLSLPFVVSLILHQSKPS